MFVIFLLPLTLSIVAALMIAVGEYGPVTKGVAVLIAVAAALLQLVPSLRESVHFLVPLLMQIFLCIWYYFVSLLE